MRSARKAAAELRRRMVIVAAVAEDECWRPFENARCEGAGKALPPALSKFNVSAVASCAAESAERVQRAMRGTPLPPADELVRARWQGRGCAPPHNRE